MQSRKVSGVNVISIFQRLHPPCTLVYCVDRTRVHCELLHCVQIMHICWQYHPDNILVSPQHVHKLVRLNVVWTSSGVSANFTDQDLFSQVLFSTQFQTTLMVMDTTIRQPSWRRPETQSSTPHFWDHCPVSLSWENKLVGTLLASKDWSYNFKLISFWSSGDWDQKGQVDYTLRPLSSSFQTCGAIKTLDGALSWIPIGGTADMLLRWKIIHPEAFVARVILYGSENTSR